MEALTAAWYPRGAAQHADAASTAQLATETEKARSEYRSVGRYERRDANSLIPHLWIDPLEINDFKTHRADFNVDVMCIPMREETRTAPLADSVKCVASHLIDQCASPCGRTNQLRKLSTP